MQKTNVRGFRAVLISSLILNLSLLLVAGCSKPSNRIASDVAQGGVGNPTLTGEAGGRVKRTSADPKTLVTVNTVYLAPVRFEGDARLDSAKQAQLDAELELAAGRQLDIDFIGVSKIKQAGANVSETASSAIDAARSLGFQGVLETNITKLGARQGSSVGSDAPAALGFNMSLRDVRNGKVAWSANYFWEDLAISSNLFRIKEKIGPEGRTGWVSLEELVTRGFDEALASLRDNRQNAFTQKSN
jgi:hypothetical protein